MNHKKGPVEEYPVIGALAPPHTYGYKEFKDLLSDTYIINDTPDETSTEMEPNEIRKEEK